jgi:hypothetical protein
MHAVVSSVTSNCQQLLQQQHLSPAPGGLVIRDDAGPQLRLLINCEYLLCCLSSGAWLSKHEAQYISTVLLRFSNCLAQG